jgi:hypothetical protein
MKLVRIVISHALIISTLYADEHDRCKQYNNFIPAIDTALFSMAIDRGCYNTATVKKSSSTDKHFLFGGILHTGNSFSLSEPDSRMGGVRNNS